MRHTYLFFAVSLAASSLMLTACDKKEQASAVEEQKSDPVVNVKPVVFETVPLVQTFSGRTKAFETADVRPQVTGIIDEILYREGGMVKKGQPLYRLSQDNYESSQASGKAAVAQAEANVNTAKASLKNSIANQASNQAQLEQAKADVARLSPLVEKQAISQQQFEQALTRYKTAQAAYASSQAAVEQARANIASAQAAVQTAEAELSSNALNLKRTIVTAPITGITDRATVSVGALVTSSQPTPLVTVSKLNPIYVDISQSSADLLKLRQQQTRGQIKPGGGEVQLLLEDGSVYSEPGRLFLTEAKVDEETGAVTLRALFKNDNYLLLPGMYVTARITQGTIANAVLLPQSALIRSAKGDTQVYIVDDANKIQQRPVTVEGTYEGQWIVTNGLQAADRLVILGGAKVQPGRAVTVQPFVEPTRTDAQPLNSATSSSPSPLPSSSPIRSQSAMAPQDPVEPKLPSAKPSQNQAITDP